MINAQLRVHVADAAWSQPYLTSAHISFLEARALKHGVNAFSRQIRLARAVEIRVDNTTITSALTRGTARAASLNGELKATFDWLTNGYIIPSQDAGRSTTLRHRTTTPTHPRAECTPLSPLVKRPLSTREVAVEACRGDLVVEVPLCSYLYRNLSFGSRNDPFQ